MPVTEGTGYVAKWQLALAVGAPVALGLGYIYYRNNIKNNKISDRNGKSKKKDESINKQLFIVKNISNGGSSSSPSKESEISPELRADRYKNEGNAYFKLGRYDKAIAHYNKAIEVCPQTNSAELATFYQNRAAAYEQLGKYNSVKADCTKAIELKPKYIKALLRRARALDFLGDLETAVEDATTACHYENYHNETSMNLSQRLLGKLIGRDVEEHMKNRKPVMPSKHFVKTYMSTFPNDPVFSRLRYPMPEDLPIVYQKALLALKEQKYDSVIPLCTVAINNPEFSTLPYNMEILLLRASSYLLLALQSEALMDLDEIIKNDLTPKNVELNAYIKRAALHVQLGEIETAKKVFETAIEKDPICADIYYHRGMMYLILNKLQKAKSDFDKVVLYNPNFCAGHMQKCYVDFRVAYAHKDKNDVDQVLKTMDEVFEKFPDNPEAYIISSQVCFEIHDYKRADMFFAKALEIDPQNSNTYVQKALLEIQSRGDIMKGIERAADYINKALSIDERCELGYETLASIEVQRGNFEEALKAYEKALQFCRTPDELAHIYTLRNTTRTQISVKNILGSDIKYFNVTEQQRLF